ncbi:MAG TPA: glycosyltransferase family 39 protein, partial [Tepidisphaeraceae bacterium]
MPDHRPIRASHFVLLGLILCAAAFLRWYKIDNDALWTDEFFSLEVSAGHGYQHLDISHDVLLPKPASLIEENSAGAWADIFLSLKRTNHPPLYFCVLRIWRSIWHSDSDFTTRGLSALMSLIAIILAFEAVRTTSGPAAGLWAAALLAVAAPQIQFSQEARGYSMLIALMMGCCAAIARIEKFGPSRKRFAALLLCAIGMLLTHYLAFALIAAILIYVAIRFRDETRRGTLAILTAALLFMLASWGPFMLSQSHHFWGNLSWMHEPGEGSLPLVLIRIATLPLKFFAAPGRVFSLAIGCVGAVLFFLPIPLLRKHPELLLWSLILWIIVLVIAVGDLARDSTGLL